MTAKIFLVIGGINALLSVMLGAFGAHALKNKLDDHLLSIYQTGVQYHFYHALGLLIIGALALWLPNSTLLKYSGGTMLAGIILFSGSLYILALSGIRLFGAVTPIGGLCFIAAWLLLIITVWRISA